MTRGILIAGNESALFSAAASEAAKRVERYAAALIPGPFPPSEGTAAPRGTDKAIPLSWSPGSPISARTLVLAAENRMGRIDDAVLICSPPALYRPAEALAPGEADSFINDHIKGWFFLVRELALYFRNRQAGTLALVVSAVAARGGKDAPADLLGLPATASFRAFSESLLASSAIEPFRILGFGSEEAGSEANFAAWFFKFIDEGGKKNSGKWYKYAKLRFF